MTEERDRPPDAPPKPPPLPQIRLRGSVALWSVLGVVISSAGLFLLTGLAASPWLFLLYPLLIGALLASLGLLALHLLHRF